MVSSPRLIRTPFSRAAESLQCPRKSLKYPEIDLALLEDSSELYFTLPSGEVDAVTIIESKSKFTSAARSARFPFILEISPALLPSPGIISELPERKST